MPATRLRGLWSSRLWILSAILGATTVYSAAATIHDANRRGLALGLVTQATAMHLSTLASSRLDRLALEGFAPAGPLAAAPPEPGAGRNTIEVLARRQRDGQSCRCRELLPVSDFFHFDAANGRITLVRVDTAAGVAAPSDSTLAAVARTEADAPRTVSNAASRLIVEPRLGDRGVVALVQRDDRGTPLAVYGMVVDRRETLAALFAQTPQHSAIDSAGLARLDSLSLEVRTASGERLFGSLGPGRAQAVARLGGSLRGLSLMMAVSPSRVAEPLFVVHSQLQLFHIAALLLATVIVLALAVTASRRELLLARARSDFIAGVSHDLRMPLAQMLIASETLALQRERTDGERVSLASSIVRETRRLVSLVDNVLLFSRSGALELKPVLRSVDLGELFDDVVDAVRLSVDDAGQTIEVAADPHLAIMGDRRLVRQALVNLVDNALKYGRAGQRIRIGGNAQGASVQLWVEDEGPGVAKADRDRIFEAYARLDHDQVSERTGTGLGLAVVRQIAAASGGRVWIEDATPRGARVVIELPAAPIDEPAVATPVPSRA